MDKQALIVIPSIISGVISIVGIFVGIILSKLFIDRTEKARLVAEQSMHEARLKLELDQFKQKIIFDRNERINKAIDETDKEMTSLLYSFEMKIRQFVGRKHIGDDDWEDYLKNVRCELPAFLDICAGLLSAVKRRAIFSSEDIERELHQLYDAVLKIMAILIDMPDWTVDYYLANHDDEGARIAKLTEYFIGKRASAFRLIFIENQQRYDQ